MADGEPVPESAVRPARSMAGSDEESMAKKQLKKERRRTKKMTMSAIDKFNPAEPTLEKMNTRALPGA